jgi:hypothetical protein
LGLVEFAFALPCEVFTRSGFGNAARHQVPATLFFRCSLLVLKRFKGRTLLCFQLERSGASDYSAAGKVGTGSVNPLLCAQAVCLRL